MSTIRAERASADRVRADGRFLAIGQQPFRVRGVTYGGFRSRLDGWQYPESAVPKRDFTAIAGAGLNTIRTYTLPPPEALEIAAELDLRLIVGLNYHDWRMEPDSGRRGRRRIREAGREAVASAMDSLAGNLTVLAVAVGNEIPVDLVRLHGIGSVEHTLASIVGDVHASDRDMLATYVNFPTTEFLEVEGQDIVTFNVFLEQPGQLRRLSEPPAGRLPGQAVGGDGAWTCVRDQRRSHSGQITGVAASDRGRGRLCRGDGVLVDRRMGRERQGRRGLGIRHHEYR